MTLILIILAIVVVIFPRLLVWAMVAVFLGYMISGMYSGLKQPGKRKRKPGHSTGSASWDHLTDR